MIAVIGAGLTGIAAAWQLSRSGHEVVVLEAADRVGGLASSITVSGQRVDLGGRRLEPAMSGSTLALLDDLVELDERPRTDHILVDGSWVPHPGSLLASARRRILPHRARAAWTALADKVLGPDRGDASLVLDPPLEVPDQDSVTDRLRSMLDRPTSLYPRRGFGAIAEAMAELVSEVRLRTKVTGLIEHDDRVIVGLGDGRIVTATHVLSTVTAGRTATWLGLAEESNVTVPSRASVAVYLTVAGRPYSEVGTRLLPSPVVLPWRLSEPANLRRGVRPLDHTVLCAEVSCERGDGLYSATADDLGRRIADDLVRCGLPDPRVLSVDVVRLPSAIPVLAPLGRLALARGEEAMAGSRRVHVAGRPERGTHDVSHLDVEAGLVAADRLAAVVSRAGELDP